MKMDLKGESRRPTSRNRRVPGTAQKGCEESSFWILRHDEQMMIDIFARSDLHIQTFSAVRQDGHAKRGFGVFKASFASSDSERYGIFPEGSWLLATER